MQCVASWIFLYFACLSPIITFGGLLAEATGKNMAAMESLVSGFVCGIVYGFFSGQPLTILGSTGPVLVFETIVFEFCKYVVLSLIINTYISFYQKFQSSSVDFQYLIFIWLRNMRVNFKTITQHF